MKKPPPVGVLISYDLLEAFSVLKANRIVLPPLSQIAGVQVVNGTSIVTRKSKKKEVIMSIKKQYLKSKPICKVTFRLPKEANNGAKHINVVGEFNKWNKDATPMKRFKNGSFSTTIDLNLNSNYQFRYLIDGIYWENDLGADAFVHCSYGNCENSVIVT